MMTINFYLVSVSKDPIKTFREVKSNPFEVGEVVNLKVNPNISYHTDFLSKKTADKISKRTIGMHNKFNGQLLKIVQCAKTIELSVIEKDYDTLTIDYYCEFVN